MHVTPFCRTVVIALAFALLAGFARLAVAKELLVASVRAAEDAEVAFRVTGESRRDAVGGEIVLGDAVYEISRVSRHGLIGGQRFGGSAGARYGEFVVFSSSYGAETAVGTPWVAAREVRHCDEPYNAFLVVYRVEGEAAVASLGPIPYPELVDDVERSQHSRVYCFMGRPGDE